MTTTQKHQGKKKPILLLCQIKSVTSLSIWGHILWFSLQVVLIEFNMMPKNATED